jgi:hypothetical protein
MLKNENEKAKGLQTKKEYKRGTRNSEKDKGGMQTKTEY